VRRKKIVAGSLLTWRSTGSTHEVHCALEIVGQQCELSRWKTVVVDDHRGTMIDFVFDDDGRSKRFDHESHGWKILA